MVEVRLLGLVAFDGVSGPTTVGLLLAQSYCEGLANRFHTPCPLRLPGAGSGFGVWLRSPPLGIMQHVTSNDSYRCDHWARRGYSQAPTSVSMPVVPTITRKSTASPNSLKPSANIKARSASTS